MYTVHVCIQKKLWIEHNCIEQRQTQQFGKMERGPKSVELYNHETNERLKVIKCISQQVSIKISFVNFQRFVGKIEQTF